MIKYLTERGRRGSVSAAIEEGTRWRSRRLRGSCTTAGWSAHATRPRELPVLAIGGAFSSGAFPELSLRHVADDVVDVVIDRSGHWVASERPDALVTTLLGFLDVKEATART